MENYVTTFNIEGDTHTENKYPNGKPNSVKHINKHIFVWVFCFLLGLFGVDRFFRGKKGILKLLTIGGFGFWFLIDWVIAVIKAYGNAYEGESEVYFNNEGMYVHRNTKGMKFNFKPIIIIVVTIIACNIIAPLSDDNSVPVDNTSSISEESKSEEKTVGDEKSTEEENMESDEAIEEVEKWAKVRTTATTYFTSLDWDSVFKYKYTIHYIMELKVGTPDNTEYGEYVAMAPAEVQNGFGAYGKAKIYIYMDKDLNLTRVFYEGPEGTEEIHVK